MKHTIKLDENKLRKIISESVKNILQESEINLPGPQETDEMINQLAPIRDKFRELGYEEAANNIQQAIKSVIKIKNEYVRNLTGYDTEKAGGHKPLGFRKI